LDDIIKKQTLKEQQQFFYPKYKWTDPQVEFSDNQWYYYQARHTVFFTAFTKNEMNKEALVDIAKDLVSLAPQLLTGFKNVGNGKDFPREILETICSIKTVDSLEEYPDKWDNEAKEIFNSNNKPLFRIKAVVRKNGADKDGHKTMLIVQSTHAIIEGADASLLSQSKIVSQKTSNETTQKTSFLTRFSYGCAAALIAPLQTLAAQIMVPKNHNMSYKTILVEQKKLRKIAKSLGISRRALMFALVAYGLNNGSKKNDKKAFSKRIVSIVYADMNTTRDVKVNSDYFKFHAMIAKFKVKNDFKSFAIEAEKTLNRVEAKNPSAAQDFFNAIFKAHRFYKKIFPFIYTSKTFRFSSGYHLNLSLTPPQRLNGTFTKNFIEPVYCGAFHPGLNVCVFSPGRTKVSFNFSMSEHHLKNVEKIVDLIDELDKSSN